ncbi:MAG: adenosylcobalamin-dependent ribonucleoside-diphosphate reductase [Clostridia bacterium]
MAFTNVISEQIWKDRYCKNNETYEEQMNRVAKNGALDYEKEFKDFKRVIGGGLFFPAGRIMSNIGLGKSKLTLNNCFTLNSIPDDMEGIFDTVKCGALVHKGGGGSGYDASMIRPAGTPTHNDAIASGPISFLRVFDTQTATVNQGSRRGANMGVLNVYHPDIEEFIYAKSKDANELKYFNLSVMVDDDFMKAKDNNEDIYLHFPVYNKEGKIEKDESKWLIKRKVSASQLWDKIMKLAYTNGEPGILFYDNLNRLNPTNYMENIMCTNPCGEYVSGILYGDKIEDSDNYWGACNLGSLILYNFVENPYTDNARINWDALADAAYWGTRFLDNIIDINFYPVEKFKNYQENMRVIGLGVMGLATMYTMLGLKYGSDECIEFTENIMNFISKSIFRASIKLAKEKGSAPFLDKEKYINTTFIKEMIKYDSEWEKISQDILKYGMRNLRHMSIAPNGTISLAFGNNCSSGLEPIFSLEYDRKVKIGGQDDSNIQVVTMRDYGYDLWLKTENKTVDSDIFVTALDLPVESHLKVLKAVTRFVDMSASKTINIPEDYSFKDTKNVYDYCYKNGIKGCTIFRPNNLREGILITKKKDKDDDKKAINSKDIKKDSIQEIIPKDAPKNVILPPRGSIKQEQAIKGNNIQGMKFNYIEPVAREYFGTTLGTTNKYKTACGSLWVTVNRDQEGNLIEIFINTSKAGICKSNIDAIGRILSAGLRSGIKVDVLIEQIQGIQCQACRGEIAKGNKLDGLSCPDIVSKALAQEYARDELVLRKSKRLYKLNTSEQPISVDIKPEVIKTKELKDMNVIDQKELGKRICPECGEELVSQGGCVVCIKGCGWSKCN